MTSPHHQVSLPPEILERIFEHLDVFSLLNCSRVCKKWRKVFVMMTYPQIGYMPKIMAKIFHYLAQYNLSSILTARQTCSLWKHGLDKLTLHNAMRLHFKSSILSEQANQLLRWRIEKNATTDPNKSHHNPFPSRTIRLQLFPDGMVSSMDVLSLTTALSLYGSHVQFLNLKIQQISSATPSIIQLPYHRPKVYMLKLARTLLQILSFMENLQGLSIYITSEFCPVEMPDLMWEEEKERIGKIPLMLNKLKAFRLISWSFRSNEMEWLYYKILRHAPNLEFFDPDFHLGYEKLYRICSEQNTYEFRLTCLRIAVPRRVMPEFFRILSKMRDLRIVHLDVFEDDKPLNSRTCVSILDNLVKFTRGKLTTISLSVYQNSRFVPNCRGISSFNPSEFLLQRDEPILELHKVSSICKLKNKLKEIHSRYYLPIPSSPSPTNDLKNLRLRGVRGQLEFLKRFSKLERLILLDYDQNQTAFKKEYDFYRLLPSLKELHSPYFSSPADHERKLLMSIVEDERNTVLRSVMPLSY